MTAPFTIPFIQNTPVALKNERHKAINLLEICAGASGTVRPIILLIDDDAKGHQIAWIELVLQLAGQECFNTPCYYFKQDPTWCWDREQEGMDISEIYKRHPYHQLIVYGDGDYWLDSFTTALDNNSCAVFPKWKMPILMTTVAPENWSYRERLLTKYFILIHPNIDNPVQFDKGCCENREIFERQRREISESKDTFIEFLSIKDISDFLQDERLLDWLAATLVYPVPEMAITLAIGETLNSQEKYKGILSLKNLKRISYIKHLNRDSFPETLRYNLLIHLKKITDIETLARYVVLLMLEEAQRELPKESYAYQEAHIKTIEQKLELPDVSDETISEAKRLIKDKWIHPRKLRKIKSEKSFFKRCLDRLARLWAIIGLSLLSCATIGAQDVYVEGKYASYKIPYDLGIVCKNQYCQIKDHEAVERIVQELFGYSYRAKGYCNRRPICTPSRAVLYRKTEICIEYQTDGMSFWTNFGAEDLTEEYQNINICGGAICDQATYLNGQIIEGEYSLYLNPTQRDCHWALFEIKRAEEMAEFRCKLNL